MNFRSLRIASGLVCFIFLVTSINPVAYAMTPAAEVSPVPFKTLEIPAEFGQVTESVIGDPALLEVETAPLDLTQLGNERILFIDDEEILAEIGKAMLERLGYLVTVRRNSIEALNTFQNQPDQFDLVITDQTKPGMTGSDLARRMLQIRPGMPIILCTGYSSVMSEEKACSLGIKGFAMKPLAKKDLAALIRKVLDGGKILS